MTCIYCGGKLDVINSRPQKRNNQIWRRRRCLDCGAIFTSHEAIDLSSALLVDSEAPRPFIEDKLYSDLLEALKDRTEPHNAARETTYTIVQELLKLPEKPQFEAKRISQAAAKVLQRLDARSYLRYVAEHPSLQ